ncbi:sodium:proton antiporter [Microbacterium horticulturae]|uniref:Sodium:proton antiporter n=1 Tax=Microbacterium horticulturae TaxID=3028316 RepID=A0ABY8C273_9MICO|nr:sodium:proton antiporter [Microbacterium sp. KACC 23027]WEG09151.1 sodium:proton antiporter [Microbacterium sp. KACC 23027]
MEDPLLLGLVIAVAGVIVIVVINTLAQRLGVAGPLLLVAVGLIISVLPFVDIPPIPPEWILVGVLPPLLYSAAVKLPAIEFRRDFGPIAGMAVVLVLVSAIVLGVFFWLVIPSVSLPVGIALGAILSPTDAVATSIAKRLGIAPRVVTMLEGESLLNDATALVLLRTAVAAIAGGFSVWGAIGTFAWGVVAALIVGAIVGWVVLMLREWIGGAAANTAISFCAPFLAYLPTEHLGGSGLVAAVVAGIVAGQGSRRRLTPEQRLSDNLNWRTIEQVLEGAVFLVMGLELRDILEQTIADVGSFGHAVWQGVWLALVALAIVLLVRTAYVSLVVWGQSRRADRLDRDRLTHFSERLDGLEDGSIPFPQGRGAPSDPARQQRRVDTMRTRVNRLIADFDYYQSQPVGWRNGTILVWAGMRGVVTLAAAQTLPREGIDHRALLVFVAFLVALISLMMQGFTLPWVVRILGLANTGEESPLAGEKARLDAALRAASAQALSSTELRKHDGAPFTPQLTERLRDQMSAPPSDDRSAVAREMLELRLISITAMRRSLADLSHGGSYSSATLRHALAELDADEMSLRLRLEDE